jgi:FAD/FMN-containing dehydrogenase
MTTPNSLSCDAIYALRASIAGEVFVPGQRGCDDARHARNLFVDQRPVAVVFAESAVDVARTVKFARAQGI